MEDPVVVAEFLDVLTEKLRPKAEDDFKSMFKMKLQENPVAPVSNVFVVFEPELKNLINIIMF